MTLMFWYWTNLIVCWDMGFSKEIQEINRQMVSKDQTLLFSATLDPTQKKLVEEMTNDPVHVKG